MYMITNHQDRDKCILLYEIAYHSADGTKTTNILEYLECLRIDLKTS